MRAEPEWLICWAPFMGGCMQPAVHSRKVSLDFDRFHVDFGVHATKYVTQYVD